MCALCFLFACKGTCKPLGLRLNYGWMHRFEDWRNVLQNLLLYGGGGSVLGLSSAIKYALASAAPHYVRTKGCNVQPPSVIQCWEELPEWPKVLHCLELQMQVQGVLTTSILFQDLSSYNG